MTNEKNELQELRLKIDELDRAAAKLFEKRMKVAADIATYKNAHGIPVLDEKRERSVIEKNASLLDDPTLRPYYADLLKNTMRISREYQARRICNDKKAAEAPRSSQTLTVRLGERSYDIIIERGAVSRAAELLDLSRKVLVVTDSGVPREYAETIAAACAEPYTVTVPEGEGSKCFEVLEGLLSELVERGFTRYDAVVAVGGGVVGDLAGSAAACYMRGIDFYNVPTTLLSQVDSSVGGKTAINFHGIKNCVGAFYQPKRVLIDPDLLATLPQRQLANGYAEAVKMALTCNAPLFEKMESSCLEDILDEVIAESVETKLRVVEADERESSYRRVLNFGHTLGHGIETAQDQNGLYHGECVALGMLPMCSEQVRARLERVLQKAGLPTKVSFDKEKVRAAVLHDKKSEGDKINCVFVEDVGSFEFRQIAPDELF